MPDTRRLRKRIGQRERTLLSIARFAFTDKRAAVRGHILLLRWGG